jgi:hypothetical protein
MKVLEKIKTRFCVHYFFIKGIFMRNYSRFLVFFFSKYHMRILLGEFTTKLGREDIFKPTVGNESVHQDSNDNGVRIVNFAT